MAANHVRDTTSQVNPNEPFSLLGRLPRHTRATVQQLAAECGVSEPTLRRWITTYNCPFKAPGGEMWIDTEDLWGSWPYQSPAEVKRPQRGGRRKKKELPADGSATSETGSPGK